MACLRRGARCAGLSYWNYRVVRARGTHGPELGLYEVYYDDEGAPWARSAEPAQFVADLDDEADLAESLRHALRALAEPVLDDTDIWANQPEDPGQIDDAP